ncbi:MAG: 3-deoxy-D-manno-octulosonic acid transferase [Candidatus Omnitrophica bacterium]|nr:3-deoxy-D-manno-octulosonic acid transferase [Candidatus Omnitrophota bacterium]
MKPTRAPRIGFRKMFLGRTLIFDMAMVLFGLFSLRRFFEKSKQAPDKKKLFRERFGRVDCAAFQRSGKKVIWVHAVSVGEVAAVRRLVELLAAGGDVLLVLSTVTPTGQFAARALEEKGCRLIYFPFDISAISGHVLDSIQPDLILLAETEIWPNFILRARERRIPIGIINGRISEKSLRGYRRIAWLMRPVFEAIDFVLVQTEQDKNRYSSLKFPASKIHVLGNMKFDQIPEQDSGRDAAALRREWGFAEEDLIIVGGSTHPGEEIILLEVFKALIEFPRLRLILAPRHPERAREVGAQANHMGLKADFYSGISKGEGKILILDTVGQLRRFYSIASLAVMGGSFIPHGGQNPIEPACASCAVLSGPHVHNFEAVYRAFITAGAAEIVPAPEALLTRVRAYLHHPELRQERGEKARKLVESERGATARHLEWIEKFFSAEAPVHA